MPMRGSEGYDLSLFEAKKEKKVIKNNILKISRKKLRTNRKTKIDFKFAMFLSFAVSIVAGVCVNLIKIQVELSEFTSQVYNKNKELEENRNEEIALKIKLDSNLSLKEIEEYSKNVLKMQKAVSGQIEYIETVNKNKAEVLK